MKTRILTLAGVILVGAIIVASIISEQRKKRILPVLNPNEVNTALVDSSLHQKGIGHIISPFNLINQDGDSVTEAIIANKIVISDFFFTTCPSICPKMTVQLKRIHDHFINNDNVIILSHTVWPEVDSVSVLKDYAQLYEANTSKWQFLTGSKIHLYDLARKSYLVAPSIEDTNFQHGGENDFVHTENIVLVDAKKRIRSYYDGTDEEEMTNLILDIESLLLKKED